VVAGECLGDLRIDARLNQRRDRLAAALARMLKERRPRSVNAAAQWLAVHAPELYVRREGEPLGEQSIRKRLPVEIGDGLPVPDAPQHRIAWRPSERKGGASEIDLEQGRLL